MDRRAKKNEKKRKQRDTAKKQARAKAAKRPDAETMLIRKASHGAFGPCWVSADWEETEPPALVTVLISRELGPNNWLPAVLMLDRTCLGVKDAMVASPMNTDELEEFAYQLGNPHGGALKREPLVAQSVVFHAIDYARKLGFEPHPDFPELLVGPRPDTLIDTPLRARELPWYIFGPYDDTDAVLAQLTAAVGEDGFEYTDIMEDDEDEESADDDDDGIMK